MEKWKPAYFYRFWVFFIFPYFNDKSWALSCWIEKLYLKPELKNTDSNPTKLNLKKINQNEFEKYKKPICSCINKHEIIGKTWKKTIKVGIF